jgi:hypothetical protein
MRIYKTTSAGFVSQKMKKKDGIFFPFLWLVNPAQISIQKQHYMTTPIDNTSGIIKFVLELTSSELFSELQHFYFRQFVENELVLFVVGIIYSSYARIVHCEHKFFYNFFCYSFVKDS